MLEVVHEEHQPQQHVPAAIGGSLLVELARDGARQMLAAALLAEVAAYVEAPALEQFLGSTAGPSAVTVTRLTAQWQDDAQAFGNRSLAETDDVYLWVDGIHLKVRLEADKVCLLVMIGVRVDGTKELVAFALADGFRESSESWADLLRDCRRRGVRAPVLEVGDGARWPQAVAKIVDDLDVLLAFYDFPAEHWIHLRTKNPIESTFATVRLRQRVTKGPGSRAAVTAMAFKLIESAQRRWRAVNAPHLVALVRAGATFENGVLAERSDTSASERVA